MARRNTQPAQTATPPVQISQEDQDVLDLVNLKWTAARTKRSTLDAELWLIERYVRPNSPRIWVSPQAQTTAMRKKTDEAYDPTAIFSNENFAAGIHSFTTSKTEKWHKFGSNKTPIDKLDPNKRKALARLEDISIQNFNRPASLFHPSMHECNLDNGAFGTSLCYGSWNDKKRCNTYMAVPFPSCYLDEDANGQIDTVFITMRKSARQIQQMARTMKDFIITPQVKIARPDQWFEVRYGVFPNDDTNPMVKGITDKAFAAVWWMPADNVIVKKGGYDRFPYFPSRFIKYPGDVYGISPAMNAMPFIKAVNVMMKDYLISGALNLRAPWWMEDDSLIPPYDQIEPGELLIGNPGTKKPEPIGPPGKLEYGERMLTETRDWIQRFFYLDYLIREQKKERQSQLEINDERDQMLRQLSAFVERLQTERLDNLVLWHIQSLMDHKIVPQDIIDVIEPMIKSGEFEISYLGQASRAQTSWKAANQMDFLQTVLPLGQQYPEAVDRVDVSRVVLNLAIAKDVEQDCIRSDDDAKAIAQKRNEAQAMQQQAAVAQPAADAMQKIAKAQALNRGG